MAPDKRPELLELTHSACEGPPTASQVRRLEELLRGDPEAQSLYLRHVHLVGALRWDLGAAAEYSALKCLKEEPATGLMPQALRRPVQPFRTVVSAGRPVWRMAVAAAAVLLMASLAYWMWPRAAEPPDTDPFAVLAQAINAEWEGAGPEVGSGLREGTHRLRSGLARIDFDSGVSVTLEGPAEFSLQAPDRAFLRRGNLTAHVPPEAIGFRVDTPALHVVDLGTSFGVAAEATGATEVCVFRGEISVALANHAQPGTQRLQAGSAARAGPGQADLKPANFDTQRFERAWPLTFGVLRSTGTVRFVRPGPVNPRRHEDNDYLIVFPERESVVLRHDVVSTANLPGRYDGPFEGRAVTIPTGTQLRSYLLQFNPVGRPAEVFRRFTGSITFDQPVVAVVATNELLAATDGPLGAEECRPEKGGRGIEGGDSFELSSDRHTVTVDWTASVGVDQLRVLVVAPPRE